MTIQQHRLLLLRHGETEWSRDGKHTSRTDLDLTETGRERAKVLGEALRELELRDTWVVSSPRRRAIQTAELAGLTIDEVSPLLAEWDYGDYEGLTTPEIRKSVPDWLVWTHGCPGGETVRRVRPRRQGDRPRTGQHGIARRGLRRTRSLLPRGRHPDGSSCRWSEVAGSR